MHNFSEHHWAMEIALELAHEAYTHNEVPVGSVVVDESGKLIGRGRNAKEGEQDASLHGEIVAMRMAAKSLGTWRLNHCILYTTLEPCPMCLSAMIQFRVGRLSFGAYDFKGGAFSLGLSLHKHHRFNHKICVQGGLRHYQCSKILSDFFRQKRSMHCTS